MRIRLLLAATIAASTMVVPTPASARQMGVEPQNDVVAAAGAHLCGGLTANELAAMAMAVTFDETGAGPTNTPSPMTLSRYDTGANLFPPGSTRDPDDREPYWHPGVGMFQMDSSGLGADDDAAWAINTSSSAVKATAHIADRYCSSGTTGASARAYAWSAWFACDDGGCEDDFQAIYQGGALVLDPDPDVSRTGGMVARSCTRGTETFPCWYVDPALAEGHTGWRAPGALAPLSDPFYVFTNAAQEEERHWIDGGNDLRAVRPDGGNARTTAVWSPSDITVDANPPMPQRPPRAPLSAGRNYDGTTSHDDILWFAANGSVPESIWLGRTLKGDWSNTAANGAIQDDLMPVAGDFNGDGGHDVLWYGPGSDPDVMWWHIYTGTDFAPGLPTNHLGETRAIGGAYTPVVGDFNADGRDDIFWYAVFGGTENIWFGRADNRFTTNVAAKQVNATGLVPIAGDFDNDSRSDIFWYGRGFAQDSLWRGSSTSAQFVISTQSYAVNSLWYQPVAGDLNGDGRHDIYWYAPGTDADAIWTASTTTTGAFTDSAPYNVTGAYTPIAGNFNGDGYDDIFWYGPGSANDAVWYWQAGGTRTAHGQTVNGTYQPS